MFVMFAYVYHVTYSLALATAARHRGATVENQIHNASAPISRNLIQDSHASQSTQQPCRNLKSEFYLLKISTSMEKLTYHFLAAPTGPTTRSLTTPPRSPRNKSQPTRMAPRRSYHTASTTTAKKSKSPAESAQPSSRNT